MHTNKTYTLITNKGFNPAAAMGEGKASETAPKQWMMEQQAMRKSEAALNPNQLTSISAMIAFIAHKSGQSEFRVERSLADHFKVPNAKFLPANDFDNAIRYLADIVPE